MPHAPSALMVKATSRGIAPPIWRDLRIEWAHRQRNLARGSRVSGDDLLHAAVRIFFVTAGMGFVRLQAGDGRASTPGLTHVHHHQNNIVHD